MEMDNYKSLEEKVEALLESGEWESAYFLLQEGDAKGDSNSTCLLGDFYLFVDGIIPDAERAISLYEKALSMGNPYGAQGLGRLYAEGQKIGIDYELIAINKQKAFYYFSKGAELKDSSSLASLGLCYLYGEGTVQDNDKAFFYGLQAAKNGDLNGMAITAYCYENGLGTKKDRYAAAQQYREILEISDEPDIMYSLSVCLADPYEDFNTQSTLEMLEEAYHWANKAVEAGHVVANLVIAWFYETGNVVNIDYEISHKLLTLAAETGDEIAQKLLKRYRKNIQGDIYLPQ